ncbi:MAG: heme lyase CcmF/NrfE family subunit [Burkholderiales bacterium]|jgi:cytochrome c-type biogenesis protein CcmF|nr:heme lyase CcmF/NrfE family subunit [Nitrosomonadaceae bacterium]
MIPELGHFALIVALCLAIVLAVVPLAGTFANNDRMMAMAKPLAAGQFLFVAFAFACLIYAFVTSDFSVKNVAANSNTKLPVYYKVTASWGSHEGSLLLWMLMLTGWTFAVALFSKSLPREVVARVLAVLAMIGIGFYLFALLTSNPFDRLLPAPPEGRDLNPLLQDPGMIYHPPMLYMGYVGFSVAFAFAIAALIAGKLDATWARWSRPWTTAAWIFLTLGIALGSAWAYYELGWGGWWFWDPVENASFMPWLVGTALIHSLAVTEKRGIFKSWTVLLAIMAFSLSLLGTFLVRSGVLTSVHAFATDPARGAFILGFLVVVIGVSLALYAWRAPELGLAKVPNAFTPASRESLLLANNVLLVVAMLAVMLGTLYPLFLDALKLGKISVGPPYFDAVFYPLMAPALFLMAVGPVAAWRNATLPDLWTRLKWAFGVAVGCAIVTPFLMGKWTPLIALGLLLAFWIIAACAAALVHRVRATAGIGLWAKLRANSASYYGMHLAHVGIAVVVIGITLVRGYETERDVRMQPGDAVTERGYTFKFVSIGEKPGPNFDSVKGVFEVSRDGRVVETLKPEKRTYFASGQTMTEAAIDSGFTRDLYVSLGEPVGKELNGAWAVRIYVKPFIDWIWAGCILMSLGGAFAIGDKRYRLRRSRKHAESPAGGAGSVAGAPVPAQPAHALANSVDAPRAAE